MLNGTVIEYYSKKKLINLFLLLLLSSAGCAAFLVVRVLFTGSYIYLFLVWNLFLAWIPFGISLVILWLYSGEKSSRPARGVTMILSFLWLLFYPNAPYILTDVVHLIRMGMYYRDMNELVTANALIWYDIILNAAFAIMGHLIGLFSLLFVHQVFTKLYGKAVGWCVVTGACLLSGFGIYLGRFVRLNSTDVIVYPFISLKEIVGNLFYLKAVLFSLSVGFFILITYIGIFAFHRLHENENHR
jgi:uncharacterized membrane protein